MSNPGNGTDLGSSYRAGDGNSIYVVAGLASLMIPVLCMMVVSQSRRMREMPAGARRTDPKKSHPDVVSTKLPPPTKMRQKAKFQYERCSSDDLGSLTMQEDDIALDVTEITLPSRSQADECYLRADFVSLQPEKDIVNSMVERPQYPFPIPVQIDAIPLHPIPGPTTPSLELAMCPTLCGLQDASNDDDDAVSHTTDGGDDACDGCIVCCEASPDAILMECGHSGICRACADRMWKQHPKLRRCPLCREPFAGIMGITSRDGDTVQVEILNYYLRARHPPAPNTICDNTLEEGPERIFEYQRISNGPAHTSLLSSTSATNSEDVNGRWVLAALRQATQPPSAEAEARALAEAAAAAAAAAFASMEGLMAGTQSFERRRFVSATTELMMLMGGGLLPAQMGCGGCDERAALAARQLASELSAQL